mmetsp:Transcript_8598/g.17435  ORF Transcript_8598/g.17435 Transcript_8598/m.17435 type:complete len:282 (+) Transcript_8598:63-908(+)
MMTWCTHLVTRAMAREGGREGVQSPSSLSASSSSSSLPSLLLAASSFAGAGVLFQFVHALCEFLHFLLEDLEVAHHLPHLAGGLLARERGPKLPRVLGLVVVGNLVALDLLLEALLLVRLESQPLARFFQHFLDLLAALLPGGAADVGVEHVAARLQHLVSEHLDGVADVEPDEGPEADHANGGPSAPGHVRAPSQLDVLGPQGRHQNREEDREEHGQAQRQRGRRGAAQTLRGDEVKVLVARAEDVQLDGQSQVQVHHGDHLAAAEIFHAKVLPPGDVLG